MRVIDRCLCKLTCESIDSITARSAMRIDPIPISSCSSFLNLGCFLCKSSVVQISVWIHLVTFHMFTLSSHSSPDSSFPSIFWLHHRGNPRGIRVGDRKGKSIACFSPWHGIDGLENPSMSVIDGCICKLTCECIDSITARYAVRIDPLPILNFVSLSL